VIYSYVDDASERGKMRREERRLAKGLAPTAEEV
jgi:hypothetical protein